MPNRINKENIEKSGFEELRKEIIDKGLCTVCGTCVGVCPERAIRFEENGGELIPVLEGTCIHCGVCVDVCPGSDVNIPLLEQAFFGRKRTRRLEDLGVFKTVSAGFSNDEIIRSKGASGGIVTQLLVYAMEKGIIDGAIVAGFDERKPWQPAPKLTDNIEEIITGAQSKYSPVPINSLLNIAIDSGFKKLAVVGCPCHIHAVRKIQFLNSPPKLAKRIKLLIGLFCGTQFYFEGTRHLLKEWFGINELEEITKLEYRGGKWPGHLIVHERDGKKRKIDRHQYIYHMLIAAYKRDRCEMCLDWSSELADISVGDYWSPSMKPGIEKGHSTIMVRSETGYELVKQAEGNGIISSKTMSLSTVVAGIGFELKKHAAAYRYLQRKRYGWPVPNYHLEIDHSPFIKELHFAPEVS